MEKNERKTSISVCRAMSMFICSTFLLRFVFAIVYFKQIGLSATYAGILQGTSSFAGAFGGIVIGYAADKKPDFRKTIFLISFLSYAATPFLLTLPSPVKHCNQLDETSLINVQNYTDDSHNNGIQTNISFFGHTSRQKLTLLKKALSSVLADHIDKEKNYNMKQNKIDWFRVNQSIDKKADDMHANIWNSTMLFATLFVITLIGDSLSGASVSFVTVLMLSAIEDKKHYARIRLWGNIAQSVIIPSVAIITYFKTVQVCGKSVSDYKFALYSTSFISGIGWVFSIFKVSFPSTNAINDSDDGIHEEAESSLKDVLKPLKTWSLLVNAFFTGICYGSSNSFLFWTMISLDANAANLSVAIANFTRNMICLGVFFVIPNLLGQLGYRNMLNLSCLAFFSSFMVMAFMSTSWLGILAEIFISVGFSLSQGTCIPYIGEIAKPHQAITLQGIVKTVNMVFDG